MKNLFLIIFLLFASITSYTQVKTIDKFDHNLYNGKLSNKDFFKKADFIFEAELVRPYLSNSEAFLNEDSTKVYSSMIWRITEIYKGENKFKKGTIQLTVDAGSYTDIRIENGKDESFNLDYNLDFCYDGGSKNIFFCTVSDFPKSSLKYETDNKIVVKLFRNESFANLRFSTTNDNNFEIYGLNNLYFKSKQDFYNYASKFRGISVPDSDKKKAEQQVLLGEFMKKQNHLLQTAKKNEKYKTSKNNNLTINIINQTVTGNGPYYFEFDVTGTANNSSTYYSNAISRLDFNTDVFGTDLAANNNIELTINNSFDPATYETVVYDVTEARINIGLTERYGLNTWNRTLLTNTSKSLFHVKIKIQQIAKISKNDYANLVFAETGFTSMFSLYTTTAGAPYIDVQSYDNTYYINPPDYLIQLPSNPVISTNLSAIHINAGLGEILTINGSGFGSIIGEVWFKNAEKGGTEYIETIETHYIQSWTDTEIKVIVPSLIRYGGTPPKINSACTGKVKIKTATGLYGESEQELNINYSITNHGELPNYPIKRPYLAKLDCTNGLMFTLHKNILYETGAAECIEKALNDWASETGIDLILEKDSEGNYITVNNASVTKKNVIWFDASRPSGMATERNFSIDINGGSIENYYRNFSDIQISNNPSTSYDITWSYNLSGLIPVGEISFYQAFLHEVGHVLGLGHVNEPNALMHYKIKDHDVATPIIDLSTVSQSTPGIAAQLVVNKSKTINWYLPYIGTLGTANHTAPIVTALGPVTFCTGGVTLTASYETGNIWYPNNETTQSINVNTSNDYSTTVTLHGCSKTSNPIIVTVCPMIEGIEINGGAESTWWRGVKIKNNSKNKPTHYMVWENSFGIHQAPKWERYREEVKYKLSKGKGLKKVYFKVKNIAGESKVVFDEIYLNSFWDGGNVEDESLNGFNNNILSIEEFNNSIVIFPNPTDGIIQIEFYPVSKSTVEIVSITGKQIYKQQYISGMKIDISKHKQGIYILKIKNESETQMSKIIKY